MARNRTSAQKSAAKRKGIIFLSHQRHLPSELPRVHRELVDVGEGRLEERAEVVALVPGWPRDSQTAKIMKFGVQYLSVLRTVRTCDELLPVV